MNIRRTGLLLTCFTLFMLVIVGCAVDASHQEGTVMSNDEGTESVMRGETDAHSPELEKEALKKKQLLRGLFETTMDAVKKKGELHILFALKNISGKDQEITHGSGQKYDIWVLNEQEEEVYRWSSNKAFTLALIHRDLKKSEQLEFEEVWNLKNNEGHALPAGTYTVMVRVMIGVESGPINQEELTAKTEIVIK